MGKEAGVPDWLPPGWRMDVRIRKGGFRKGHRDKYFIEPSSKHLFRSKAEVLEYLKEGKFRSRPRKREKEYSEQTSCGWVAGSKKRRQDSILRKEDRGRRYKAVRKLFCSPCSRSKRNSTQLGVSASSEGHITQSESSDPCHNDSKLIGFVHTETGQFEEKKGVRPQSMSSVNVVQVKAVDSIEEQNREIEKGSRSSSSHIHCDPETEPARLGESRSSENQVDSVAVEGAGSRKHQQKNEENEQQPVYQRNYRTRHKINNSAGWGRCEGDSKSKRLVRVHLDGSLSKLPDALPIVQAKLVDKPLVKQVYCEAETEKSQSGLPFGDAWLDPCLHFAFKTLAGDNNSKFLGFDQADVSQVAENLCMNPQPVTNINAAANSLEEWNNNAEKQSRYRGGFMDLNLEIDLAELGESGSTENGVSPMAVNSADTRKEQQDNKGSTQQPVNPKRPLGRPRLSTQQPANQKRPRGRPRLCMQHPGNHKKPRGRPRLNKPSTNSPCEGDSKPRLLPSKNLDGSSEQTKLLDELALCEKPNKTRSSQSVLPFCDVSADPCLEFAFKTLTGDKDSSFLGFYSESVQVEKKGVDCPSIHGGNSLQVLPTDSIKEENERYEKNEIHINLSPKTDQSDVARLGESTSAESTVSLAFSACLGIEQQKSETSTQQSVRHKNHDIQHKIKRPAGWGRCQGDLRSRRLVRQSLDIEPSKLLDPLYTHQAKVVDTPPGEPADCEKVAEAQNPPLVMPFGDVWSDPCLEFAFKTLIGVIPVPDLDLGVRDLLQEQPHNAHTQSLASPVSYNILQSEFNLVQQMPSSSSCMDPTLFKSPGLTLQNHTSRSFSGQ